jgi:hypothetical protein
MRAVLLIDERILADGTHAKSWASPSTSNSGIHLRDDDGTEGDLSFTALDRVMTKYGRPLETDIALDGPHIELANGCRLRRLRFHAVVDAEARDYLVWERPNDEPLAVVATMAAAALRYLVMRLAAEREQPHSKN